MILSYNAIQLFSRLTVVRHSISPQNTRLYPRKAKMWKKWWSNKWSGRPNMTTDNEISWFGGRSSFRMLWRSLTKKWTDCGVRLAVSLFASPNRVNIVGANFPMADILSITCSNICFILQFCQWSEWISPSFVPHHAYLACEPHRLKRD